MSDEQTNPKSTQATPSTAGTEEAKAPESAKKKRRGCRRAFIVLLLFALVAAGAWWYLGRPMSWQQAWHAIWPVRPHPAAPAPGTPLPAPKAPAPPTQMAPEHAPISSAEARALMQAIDELRAKIEDLEQKITNRNEQEAALMRVQLLLALARASDASASLAEIAASWRRAAILDAASSESRARAKEAKALLVQALRAESALKKTAKMLAGDAEAPRNLLPEEGIWGWLGKWFHFYRSPKAKARQRIELARTLRAIAAGLRDGKAPGTRQWEQIRARALLALEEIGKAKEVALPADLAAIEQKARALRAAAEARLMELER